MKIKPARRYPEIRQIILPQPNKNNELKAGRKKNFYYKIDIALLKTNNFLINIKQ